MGSAMKPGEETVLDLLKAIFFRDSTMGNQKLKPQFGRICLDFLSKHLKQV